MEIAFSGKSLFLEELSELWQDLLEEVFIDGAGGRHMPAEAFFPVDDDFRCCVGTPLGEHVRQFKAFDACLSCRFDPAFEIVEVDGIASVCFGDVQELDGWSFPAFASVQGHGPEGGVEDVVSVFRHVDEILFEHVPERFGPRFEIVVFGDAVGVEPVDAQEALLWQVEWEDAKGERFLWRFEVSLRPWERGRAVADDGDCDGVVPWRVSGGDFDGDPECLPEIEGISLGSVVCGYEGVGEEAGRCRDGERVVGMRGIVAGDVSDFSDGDELLDGGIDDDAESEICMAPCCQLEGDAFAAGCFQLSNGFCV